MNALEMREHGRAVRRARYFGKRYHYNTSNDGRVEIGVVQGLGEDWIVGYITESCATRRVKTKRLEPCKDPTALQVLLDQWAHERQLEGVTDVQSS